MTVTDPGTIAAPPVVPPPVPPPGPVAPPDARRSWLLDVAVPRLLLIALTVATAWTLHGPVSDPDTFWHLRAGEQLLRTWSFLPTDDWSAFNTRPWVLHEWGPEVLLALAARVDGLAGVVVLHQLGIVLGRRGRARPVPLAGHPAAGPHRLHARGGRPGHQPRSPPAAGQPRAPGGHGAGVAGHRRRPPPPVVAGGAVWVWACCHGFWVLGPLLGGVVASGACWTSAAPGATGGPRAAAAASPPRRVWPGC